MLANAAVLLLVFAIPCAKSQYCSQPNSLRLYPNYGTYGIVQVCYNSYWRTACEYGWGYEEARVACKQLGYSGCAYPVTSAGSYFGYSWSYYMSYYYSCSGTETSLDQCPLYSPYYYYCNDGYYDAAGVYCSQSSSGSDGCSQGEVRLAGSTQPGEGRAEYCEANTWVPMCSLSLQTAELICQELGYNVYTWSSVFNDERYGTSDVSSSFSYLNCYSYHQSLDQCNIQYNYQCNLYSCSTEYGMKCYNPGICEEGSLRLAGGDIEQEGRPEICLNGVWGSICGYYWDQLDGFIFCEDLGFTEPGTGPDVSSYSEFGDGDYPIIYSYIYCYGYEKTFADCQKTVYPYFSCSRTAVAGLRCYEDCVDGDIRLFGGTDSEGTVEICYGQLWGLIAETGWDDVDAQVACHQLGYPTNSATAVYGSTYGKPNKAVHVSNVNCVGSEERVGDCTKTSISLNEGKTTYKSASVAGIKCLPTPDPTCVDNPTGVPEQGTCTSGMIELFGGNAGNEGTLRYCYKGQWSPVCALNEAAGTVACKQLDFTQYTNAAIFTQGEFPSFLGQSFFNNITCSSDASESTLSSCDIFEGDCLPLCNNIGIRCFDPGDCDQGAVRLSDGVIDQEGRVEVCHDGVWGSICDDGWDSTDAHVICTQLGYDKLEPIAYANSHFGAGDGPIIYSQMTCGGWESDINDCGKAEYLDFACTRQQVAGVLCGYDCADGDIRLNNMAVVTPGTVEGIVEICFNNIWGLISESGWSSKDAKVACQQLGYIGEGALPYEDSNVGTLNKPVLFGDVSCTGNEVSIGDCLATSYSLQEAKDLLATVNAAGVTCPIPSDCDIPPIGGSDCQVGYTQLTGGDGKSEGNLEYCYNGYWSPICNLNEIDASVACKQLGFIDYSWSSIFTDGKFGASNGDTTSLFYSFNCTDSTSTSKLTDCNLIDNCTSVCDNPTGIRCYDQQQCEEGAVRLADGVIAQEGRVEVCINGVWGSVCSSGWDDTDSFVTCKQLGYGNAEPISYNKSDFGSGQGPIIFANLDCEGWETKIVQCYSSPYGSFSCSRDQLTGVFCHDDCADGQVKLVGGSNDAEGIVEICFESLWGTISATTWTDTNGDVTCKQLGYTGGSSVPGSQFGEKPNVVVHLSSVKCQGSENKLVNCELDPISLEDGKTLSAFVDLAGVVCIQPDAPGTTAKTDSSPEAANASSSATSGTIYLSVAGVLAALIVLIVIALIVAVVVFVIKMQSGKQVMHNRSQIDTNRSVPLNIQHDAVNPMAEADVGNDEY